MHLMAEDSPDQRAAVGTNTIDTSAAVASSPTTYDERPPALSWLPGKIGGTGETASAISATSSDG